MYQLGIGGIKKKKSYVFSGFDNSISCGWERKSTTGRFVTSQFFRWSEIFLLSVRTNSMNENFLIMIQSIFPSWALAPTHCAIFMRESFIPLFLVFKGLLYLYNRQNNTWWLLVDMEYLFSCLTRHLTRSLRSLASYQFKQPNWNSISTRAMYYSLHLWW